MHHFITYIVTAYNEEKNLSKTVQEILKLETIFPKYEILIINDGSIDNTQSVIERLKKKYKKVRNITHKNNKGFGATYRTGFQNAKGKYCILIPGDNAHPAHTVIPILKKASTVDIIIPYTINPEARSEIRQLLSKIFAFSINLISGLNIRYYNGLVLHRTNLLNVVNSETSGYAYQAEILVKLLKSGATFEQVGTLISERETGKTKAFEVKNILKVLYAYFIIIRFCWIPFNNKRKKLIKAVSHFKKNYDVKK